MVTLATLLSPRTRVQWRDALLEELRAAGFALALAPSNDNRRNVTELVAAGLAKVDEVIGKVAAGAFLDTALEDWLPLRAKSGFDVDAKPATLATGTVRLTCAATAGPYALAPGALWVGRPATGAVPARRFQTTTGGALAAGGTLDVQVSAEAPGGAYNLGNGQITTVFSGALPGVTVSNPAGLSGSWLIAPGTDAEQPDPLKARCRARWGTLGRGATDAAYAFLASSAHPEITRVRVYAGPGDGTLTVILAGDAAGVSNAAVNAAQAEIDAKHPKTDAPTARSASLATTTPAGTVVVRAAQRAAAQAGADVARLALLRSLDIGEGLDLGAIYAVLRQPGVVDVDLVTPAGDTPIAYDAVAGLDLSALVWVDL